MSKSFKRGVFDDSWGLQSITRLKQERSLHSFRTLCGNAALWVESWVGGAACTLPPPRSLITTTHIILRQDKLISKAVKVIDFTLSLLQRQRTYKIPLEIC